MTGLEILMNAMHEVADTPEGRAIIQHNKGLVSRLSKNKKEDNQTMNNLEKQSKGVQPATIQKEGPQMKTITFGQDAFSSPKMTAQPAPVADTEIKAQAAKEDIPFQKEVFELFNLGLAKAEKQYPLEGFISKCEEIGMSFKKAPKTFAEAWAAFEKYARKTLDI